MNTRRRRIAALLGSIILAAVACRGAGSPTALGRGGDVGVEPEELAAYIRIEKREEPGKLSPAEREMFLRRLVVRKSLAIEAEAAGLANTPKVEKQLFQWKLEEYPDFFWKTQVRDKVTVSDAELRDFLKPKERFLLNAISAGDGDDGRREADRIHAILKGGADFEETARKFSLGNAAAGGGDLGWQEPPTNMLDDVLAGKLRQVSPGSFTEPVQTGIGWVIFRVREYSSPDATMERLREQATIDLRQQKYSSQRASMLADMRTRARIVYPAEVAGAASGAPLAVVDGFTVTPEQVQDPTHDAMRRPVWTRKELLEKFIDSFVVVREVERLKLENDPAIEPNYRVTRYMALSTAALDKAAAAATEISAAEIRAEYDKLYLPEVYDLSVIQTADKAKADAALVRLKAGDDFAAVSEEHTVGRLKESKGRLGYLSLGIFPDAVRKSIEALPDGSYTGVMANEGMFLIVMRHAKKPIPVPSFDEVKEQIRQRIQLRKRSDFLTNYVKEYEKKLKIEVDRQKFEAFKG